MGIIIWMSRFVNKSSNLQTHIIIDIIQTYMRNADRNNINIRKISLLRK
jgi:hypothetical protein